MNHAYKTYHIGTCPGKRELELPVILIMADEEAAGRSATIPALLQEIVESLGFVGRERFVPRTFAPISGHNENCYT